VDEAEETDGRAVLAHSPLASVMQADRTWPEAWARAL
jgi:hypothetical protein